MIIKPSGMKFEDATLGCKNDPIIPIIRTLVYFVKIISYRKTP